MEFTFHFALCAFVSFCVYRVNQEINHLIDRLHIVQNCQLALLHGSQIDWSSDPELCKLVCELGQPVTQRVD